MKDLVAMRHKYWAGVKTLWPAKRSAVAVPFCWEGFKINNQQMKDAQDWAMLGFWNHANYHLTGAYCGGAKNEMFWDQFANPLTNLGRLAV